VHSIEGDISNDLDGWIRNLIFKVTVFLKSNFSKTMHFRDKFTKEH